MRFQAKIAKRRLIFDRQVNSSNPVEEYQKKGPSFGAERIRAILSSKPGLLGKLQRRMLVENDKTSIGWEGTPNYISAAQLANTTAKLEGLITAQAAATLVDLKLGTSIVVRRS